MSALDHLSKIIKGFGALSPAEQVEFVGELNKETREAVEREAFAATAHMRFIPNSGPQARAARSLADLLLYGGEAGGGKSALGVGLGFNDHYYSLVVRRRFTQLAGLTKIAIAFNGGKGGYAGGNRPKLTLEDGLKSITFGANQYAGDEDSYQGDPFDYKYFDEGCQLLETQIRFHCGWIRLGPGVPATQRRRAIIGSNPPIDASGDWIVKMFRPWLDVAHPKPAKDGELRWFITDDKGEDAEVDGPQPVTRDARDYIPKSRTFIRAHLSDNPYLTQDDNYKKELDALPEPLRSAIRDGNFMNARRDAERQVIPMAWIIAAQDRWRPDGWKQYLMTAIAGDPAGGGVDAQEIVFRHGPWFGEPVTHKGASTSDGAAMAAEIVKVRRAECPVVLDVGGGYAGAVLLRLADNGIIGVRFNGSNKTTEVSRDGARLRFANKRSLAHWRMREALNPEQEGGSPVALPPDPELRADLAAATYTLGPNGIQVEPKADIKERIGRSPGKGDATIMCLAEGDQAVMRQVVSQQRNRSLPVYANMSHAKIKQANR